MDTVGGLGPFAMPHTLMPQAPGPEGPSDAPAAVGAAASTGTSTGAETGSGTGSGNPGGDSGKARQRAQDHRNAAGLTPAEQDVVRQLQARDREVRNHEQAHATVGGQYAGAPTYTYQTGPDGNRYAVGGEVAIDVAPIPEDPAATIDKMEVVKAAALAPAEPSSADRQVAALADAQRAVAIADLAALRAAERPGATAPGTEPRYPSMTQTQPQIDLRA